MTIEEKENIFHEKLYELYITNNDTSPNNYISDGIINYNKWKQSEIKLLFVLKEPNTGDEDGSWDLHRLFEDIAVGKRTHKSPTIYQMVKIARIIDILSKKKNEDNFKDEILDHSFLLNCAIINIKKNYGGAEADWDEIIRFGLKYSEQLKEQIDLISPNIVYCGGYDESVSHSVYNLTCEALKLKTPKKSMKYKSITINIHEGITLIDAYHPTYPKMELQTRKDLVSFLKK